MKDPERAATSSTPTTSLTTYLDQPTPPEKDHHCGAQACAPTTNNLECAVHTILLVEDDEDLRNVLECYLDIMGYRVLPCCDAQSALALFYGGVPFDALVSDLEMPGMSGFDLAQEITLTLPALPVLIVSGAVIASEMVMSIARRNWKFIAKPYTLATITDLLEPLLPSRLPRESVA